MMVNHMDDNDDYGEILLDTKEPFAKKILEFFTYKDSLEILQLTEDPISVNDISARSGYSKMSIYRRIPDLLDTSMLIAVGREKDPKNHGRVSSRLYEKSFYAAGVRVGPSTEHCHCQCTIIEILPKRRFYGQILRTVRSYRR